jgi:hypothetical protein
LFYRFRLIHLFIKAFMKLFSLFILVVIFSCGKNLVEEVENIKPFGLIYPIDSIMFDTSISLEATSVKPFVNEGSGSVQFEISSPIIDALRVNKNTGEVTVSREITPNTYFLDIVVRNFVGATQFPRALTLVVK